MARFALPGPGRAARAQAVRGTDPGPKAHAEPEAVAGRVCPASESALDSDARSVAGRHARASCAGNLNAGCSGRSAAAAGSAPRDSLCDFVPKAPFSSPTPAFRADPRSGRVCGRRVFACRGASAETLRRALGGARREFDMPRIPDWGRRASAPRGARRAPFAWGLRLAPGGARRLNPLDDVRGGKRNLVQRAWGTLIARVSSPPSQGDGGGLRLAPMLGGHPAWGRDGDPVWGSICAAPILLRDP
jgi:hypothetical protein